MSMRRKRVYKDAGVKTVRLWWKIAFPFALIITSVSLRPKIVSGKGYLREIVSGKNVIIAPKHVSNLDPLALGAVLGPVNPVRFVAQVALFRVPFVGSIVRWLGAIPIKRLVPDVRGMFLIRKAIKEGWNLVIYPEGGLHVPDKYHVEESIIELCTTYELLVYPVSMKIDGGVGILFRKVLLSFEEPLRPAEITGTSASELMAKMNRIS